MGGRGVLDAVILVHSNFFLLFTSAGQVHTRTNNRRPLLALGSSAHSIFSRDEARQAGRDPNPTIPFWQIKRVLFALLTSLFHHPYLQLRSHGLGYPWTKIV